MLRPRQRLGWALTVALAVAFVGVPLLAQNDWDAGATLGRLGLSAGRAGLVLLIGFACLAVVVLIGGGVASLLRRQKGPGRPTARRLVHAQRFAREGEARVEVRAPSRPDRIPEFLDNVRVRQGGQGFADADLRAQARRGAIWNSGWSLLLVGAVGTLAAVQFLSERHPSVVVVPATQALVGVAFLASSGGPRARAGEVSSLLSFWCYWKFERNGMPFLVFALAAVDVGFVALLETL